MFPPMIQILGTLPFGPLCRTVRKGLMEVNTTTALATIQIMVGLFNIGLGPGRTSIQPGDFTNLGAAYWLGAVYITCGITSLFFCPSACWIRFIAFVNIQGAIFSIVGIVLYAMDLKEPPLASLCYDSDVDCLRVAYFAQSLLMGMDITLIVMTALQLCVCITFAMFCIMASFGWVRKEADGDSHQSMLNEVKTGPGS